MDSTKTAQDIAAATRDLEAATRDMDAAIRDLDAATRAKDAATKDMDEAARDLYAARGLRPGELTIFTIRYRGWSLPYNMSDMLIMLLSGIAYVWTGSDGLLVTMVVVGVLVWFLGKAMINYRTHPDRFCQEVR